MRYGIRARTALAKGRFGKDGQARSPFRPEA